MQIIMHQNLEQRNNKQCTTSIDLYKEPIKKKNRTMYRQALPFTKKHQSEHMTTFDIY